MNLEQIDTSTTAGKAEVMRLAALGRRVVSQPKGHSRPLGFSTETGQAWDWQSFDYAIIAEPVGPDEVFVYISKGGACYVYGLTADEALRKGVAAVRYIRADLAGEVKP